ncbi:hypothetical protein BD310DRAFT_917135 [Dichomitus squalens]|uniref:Uncharacterized protein n=1 Tax=Dichomitus squalens TaxID=114155 RepID=A0A4Q9Q721_9APHY|nr:hypothetical protein BD310DRAFT_917135 [Dichomitus squalens]
MFPQFQSSRLDVLKTRLEFSSDKGVIGCSLIRYRGHGLRRVLARATTSYTRRVALCPR